MDVACARDSLRSIKIGVQLSGFEVESYKALVKGFKDIFA